MSHLQSHTFGRYHVPEQIGAGGTMKTARHPSLAPALASPGEHQTEGSPPQHK